jgi:16S rRNA (cytosine1402-N4)-methyltransferase
MILKSMKRLKTMKLTASEHQPVFLEEALKGLAIKPDGVYIDGTFGQGGHSKAILDRLSQQGRLFAMDKDVQAVQHGKKRFSGYQQFYLTHESFSSLAAFADRMNIKQKVDGVLLDLGVSSVQLDNSGRGFSFMKDGPLDMRMDQTRGITAADWLSDVDENVLASVIKTYGEERYAGRVAHAIVTAQKKHPIETTKQLADIVASVVSRSRRDKKHPATRTFQAIRIFMNEELVELEKVLEQVLEVLTIGGRLVVISFHSLEDRMVKQFIRRYEKGESYPRGFPQMDIFIPRLKRIGRAIKPSKEAVRLNVRARSAVLRIAEKIA